MQVSKPKQIFKEGILVDRSFVTIKKKRFKRYRVDRQDAAAILVHNKEKNTIVMVKQFRYAIHDKVKGNIYEIPAGKIDAGEKAIKTAVRETEEETGYKIRKEKLQLIAEFFAAPGYTTEKFYVYYTKVKSSDRKTKGGGLASENEYIQIEEMPVKKFIQLATKGKFEDAKTLVAAQWFLLNKK